jgi:mono/diheme cytochrome c family protein
MLLMWKSERQKAVGRRQKAESRRQKTERRRRKSSRQMQKKSDSRCGSPSVGNDSRAALCLLLTAYCLLAAVGCRRDMQDQPKMKPYRSSTFFTDGQSSRQLVEGTVPRGFLKLDTEFYTGKKPGRTSSTAAPAESPAGPQPAGTSSVAGPAPQGAAAYPDDVEVFPIAITKETVTRGKERYEIFCSACHGLTGNGDGMIVRRGFRRAASFNDDRLRQAPVGHFFDAITNGWGAMPSYAPQIPTEDRWAIIAYVRALQLSQQSQQAQTPSPEGSSTGSPAPQAGGQHP